MVRGYLGYDFNLLEEDTLWPNTWSVPENVPRVLEKTVYLVVVG